MDVDAMSMEEQNNLMRKGACFKCKQPGHLSRDCKKTVYQNQNVNKSQMTWQKKPKTPEVKKMKGKELHSHVRTLMVKMDNNNKDKFFKQADEEGF